MPRPAALLLVFAVAVSSAEASAPQATRPSVDNGATIESAPKTPAAAIPAQAPRSFPKRLVPFYVSFATMQALDVHSTLRALDRGAIEGNVFVQPLVSRPAAFVAVKAGVTAGLLIANARLSRRHRVAALVMMVAANGLYAAIVAHNYRVAAR